LCVDLVATTGVERATHLGPTVRQHVGVALAQLLQQAG
jgi:hypothetical protein